MREIQIRVRSQIRIDLLPVVGLVPHFLAVAANGQQPLNPLHVCRGQLQLCDASIEPCLQRHHSFADPNPCLELDGIERLRHIIVGPRGETRKALASEGATVASDGEVRIQKRLTPGQFCITFGKG